MGLAGLGPFCGVTGGSRSIPSVFIYQVEENPRYVALTDPIFKWLEPPDHHAVTSTITMTELLVQPYRESNERRAKEFYALLSTYPNLEWIVPSLEIADIAARSVPRIACQLPTPCRRPLLSRLRRPGWSQTIRSLHG